MEYLNNTIFDNLKDDINNKNLDDLNELNNSDKNNEFTLSNINKKKIKRMHSTEINDLPFIKNDYDFNPKIGYCTWKFWI